jgi:hypothetical protein
LDPPATRALASQANTTLWFACSVDEHCERGMLFPVSVEA